MTHLHFTFGPVQSFVAQARRTRDLYAGSLLLSHLAITAMKAVGGDKIILPDFKALSAVEAQSDHATAPNRFVAKFDSEAAAAAAGRAAEAALQAEWRNVADAVWSRYLEKAAAHGQRTAEIWERQRDHFWNVSWVVGPASATDLLDRRKNWQTQSPPVEGGDHCVLMGHLQELSGFIRSKQRREQDTFWQAVRAQPDIKKLDLEDDERLCAIAFVKRFFPHVSKEAIGRELDMQNWPSTVSIAAVPWQLKIKVEAKPDVLDKAKDYAQLVVGEPGAHVSSARRISMLKDFPQAAGEFPKLSGNFLNHTALANERGTPLNNNSKERRNFLLDELRKLEAATGDRAGNFYALLLMDGDSMGRLISDRVKAGLDLKPVAAALTRFAGQAPGLMDQHDGICVYAGGDDLLAMLPLDRALEAVSAARAVYREAFREEKIEGKDGTISAGLVFAHYRCAFSRVLAYAHDLLDAVAKDAVGRDAVAIGVLKPGGIACQWSAQFAQFIQDGDHCFAPLLKAYQDGERGERGGLTSSFLYNLRARFGELLDDARQELSGPAGHSSPAPCFDDKTLRALFVAEYLHGRREKDAARAQQQLQHAEQLMRQLIIVCHQPDLRASGRRRFDLDGARLVKFLALGGKEGAE